MTTLNGRRTVNDKNKQRQKQATAKTSNGKNKQRQEQATTRTSNDKNKQRQEQATTRTGNDEMRGSFTSFRMTASRRVRRFSKGGGVFKRVRR
jgi:hypothetical protein